MKRLQAQQGYVALLAVLIVGAASLAISTALLITGADSQRSMLVTQSSVQARVQADACGEDALQRIHDNTAYTGTANVTLAQGNCNLTVTNTGGATRQVDADSTVNGVVRKIRISATIGASNISITSWQDIS